MPLRVFNARSFSLSFIPDVSHLATFVTPRSRRCYRLLRRLNSSPITYHSFGYLPFTIYDLLFASVALNLFRFLQLLTTGLSTGLLFADRIGVTPIRPQLSASSFVLFQQQLHIRFAVLMPILLFTSLLSGLISLVLLRRELRTKTFVFTAVATLCTLIVIALTRAVNIPVNEALMTWQASYPPSNVMELWSPWEQAHTIRTIVSLIGFSSLLLAVLSTRRA